MLKSLILHKDRIDEPTIYPFNVPAIRTFERLDFHSRVTCFAGENGTGKSTLLEAMAAHIGFGREGGNRDMHFGTSESSRATEPLTRALRLCNQQIRRANHWRHPRFSRTILFLSARA